MQSLLSSTSSNANCSSVIGVEKLPSVVPPTVSDCTMPELGSETPSTLGNVRSTKPESAFPTPPHRLDYSGCSYAVGATNSRLNLKDFNTGRAASTPPEATNIRKLPRNDGRRNRGFTDGQDCDLRRKLMQSNKRNQYFEEAFAFREPSNTSTERVTRDSIVLVDIKINRFLENEGEFLIDFSFLLSEIYQRPASCIMVVLTSEAAILINGNSEPAYYITVTALAPDIAATKNKRSAHLIQTFMQDHANVSTNRGVVRFDPLSNENFATRGETALHEVQRLERLGSEEHSFLRSIGKQKNRRSKRFSSVDLIDHVRSHTHATKTASAHSNSSSEEFPERPTKIVGAQSGLKLPLADCHELKKVRKRRSVMAFFGL